MSDETQVTQESTGSTSCFVFSLLAPIAGHLFITPINSPIGFWMRALYYASCLIGGLILSSIGNKLRISLMPDAIYTSEGMWGLLKAKIWWKIGPQFVGAVIPPILWGIFYFAKVR